MILFSLLNKKTKQQQFFNQHK